MNTNDSVQSLLEQLHDIHLPDTVSWWPLAPGWYLLIIILLLFIFFLFRLSKKLRSAYKEKFIHNYRRIALKQLKQLQSDYQQHQSITHYVAALNGLLKQVAITAYGRSAVATLVDYHWFSFLDAQLPQKDNMTSKLFLSSYEQSTIADYFIHYLYQSSNQTNIEKYNNQKNSQALTRCVKHWIEQHKETMTVKITESTVC